MIDLLTVFALIAALVLQFDESAGKGVQVAEQASGMNANHLLRNKSGVFFDRSSVLLCLVPGVDGV